MRRRQSMHRLRVADDLLAKPGMRVARHRQPRQRTRHLTLYALHEADRQVKHAIAPPEIGFARAGMHFAWVNDGHGSGVRHMLAAPVGIALGPFHDARERICIVPMRCEGVVVVLSGDHIATGDQRRAPVVRGVAKRLNRRGQ
ncbi:hypothetical protein PanNE5_35610 [Pandoraea sp. NE5]|nr:hypothetical protein PanNE5_35610 [Pandoraea sp. NE5]